MPTLRLAAVAAVLALSGCLPGLPRVEPPPGAPSFDPLVFFEGRTEGAGTLHVRGRPSTDVEVESAGRRLPDGRLELRQLVRLGDGAPEESVWVLERLGPGRYAGTLSDAAGPVAATADGPALTVRYPMGGGLRMTQRLTLGPTGQTARTLATVRWKGLPVAHLDETIRRR